MAYPNYTVATETANGAVSERALHAEIVAAGPYSETFLGVAVVAGVCTTLFGDVLPGGEQATVDGVLAAHTGGLSLSELKQAKCALIDARTDELMAIDGFLYYGARYSLADDDIKVLAALYAARDDAGTAYPIYWEAANNLSKITLDDSAELATFYIALSASVRAFRDAGTAIKDTVRAAVDAAGVAAVSDNRVSSIVPFVNELSTVFDGTGWVSLGDVADFQLERTDAFSFSLWYKTSAVGGSQCLIAKQGLDYYNTPGYYVRINYIGIPQVIITGTTDDLIEVYDSTNEDPLNDGVWRHLAVTYDGSSTAAGVNIWLNGVLRSKNVINDSLTQTIQNAKPLSVGNLAGEAFPFTGSVDEVSVWARELTDDDIGALYNGGSPADVSEHTSVADCIAWYRAGDGDTYPTWTDNIGANAGTMTSMDAGDLASDVP